MLSSDGIALIFFMSEESSAPVDFMP
jgi:hypothetical protein